MAPPLTPDQLCRRCDPDDVPFASTAEIGDATELLGQARAVDAIRFAIGVQRDGYNLFAVGPAGVGKRTLLRQFLESQAVQQPPTSDWCYVANLAEPHRPRALRVPPGVGARLRADVARAIAALRTAMPAAFDSDEYRSRKQQLVHDVKQREEAALAELQRRARDRRVAVARTDTGLVVAPLRGDDVLEAADFAQLPEPEQAERKAALELTGTELAALFRQFHDWGHQHLAALAELGHDVAAATAARAFAEPRAAYAELPAVQAFLAELERDIADHPERFAPHTDDGVEEAVRRALHRDGDGTDRAEMLYLDAAGVGWADDTGAVAFDVRNNAYHTYRVDSDGAGTVRVSIDGMMVLTRPGFITNGAIAIGDQTNDAQLDATLRIRSIAQLCP